LHRQAPRTRTASALTRGATIVWHETERQHKTGRALRRPGTAASETNGDTGTLNRQTPRTPKILLIEDETRLVHVLEAALKREGYAVTIARDGIEALNAMHVERPDVVILDTMSSWIGAAPARLERRNLPAGGPAIIALDGKGKALKDVRVWETTDDDRAAKPFHVKELIARVKAAQQRTPTGMLRTGPIEIDLQHETVSVNGAYVALTGKEFALLRRLLDARGRVLTRSMLRETVWEHTGGHSLDTRTVDVHVSRLRRKLGSAGRYILTVQGVGYRCFA
jgi:two-component system, OmpR family, phosphate regulon response regulator PhoB